MYVCVCVCVREREVERIFECVCIWMRKKSGVCVSVREREREFWWCEREMMLLWWSTVTGPASLVYSTDKTLLYSQRDIRGKFHQLFTCAFFVRKSFRQLFSSYVLVKKHFHKKNVRIKCLWNWPQVIFLTLSYTDLRYLHLVVRVTIIWQRQIWPIIKLLSCWIEYSHPVTHSSFIQRASIIPSFPFTSHMRFDSLKEKCGFFQNILYP